MRTEAIQELLSLFFETWQSVQPFVSVARTVCGGCVLKALPLYPAEEMVGAWLTATPRVPSVTLTVTALEERTGMTLWPCTEPSMPSISPSVRKTCGL